jgi:Histidine kinase-, DNA gyrase B-, and HSP90-like ATPase
MKFFTLLFLILTSSAFGFMPISQWNVCEDNRCKDISSGDDLYLKHNFKTNKAIYKAAFLRESIESCIQKNDCWLYLGSVGDTVTVRLNDAIIGKFENYVHFESLKFHIPTNLFRDTNQLTIVVTDLNQTRFGLRSPDIGIGQFFEVNRKANIDWILRTGSPLLSAFTLFVLFIGLIATYTAYRNKKILPIIGLSFISVLYLLSFSELPRQYIAPVFASGPMHFILRLTLDLAIVIVALSLYRPHQKISLISKLPYLYILPIALMAGAATIGVNNYAFYKTTMLIVAPLVVGGGLVLAVLSYYYYEPKERQIVFPVFLGLLGFQVYDLIVFWELVQGSFTVKWYLPFLVISFSWIYVRRRIFEVRTLKIDALVGDEVRKLAHDLAAPISNLKSLVGTNENSLITKNIKDIDILTNQVLGKYNTDKICKNSSQDNLHIILSDLKEKFEDKINFEFKLSMEFDWYSVDATLFTRTFTNLITNAIKANSTKIGVKGYFKNNHLTIDITDNGIGIPKVLQPYIFEKGITSNKTTGNGLGLSYIRECFLENGFSIHLSKSDSNGTLFQIQIPLTEIILIDDNPLVRDTWTTLSRKLGIQIKAYSKGKDVELNQIQLSTPIFVDLELENENGLDTYTKLTNLGFSNVLLATGGKGELSSSIKRASKSFPFEGAIA